MNLCVIPARGGSKRIPRESIRPFAGKPMISHAIGAAQKSRFFSKIIASKDNAEEFYTRALTLPLYPAMTDADVILVCESLKKALSF